MTITTTATHEARPLDARPTDLPRRSLLLFRWFRWWARGYLAKHFHAVRIARDTCPQVPTDIPLILVLNHPSWWDPLIGVALSSLFPDREHYAPMESKALARYRMFEKLGFYPVEPGSRRGAVAFLRTTSTILERPGQSVWITAQGQFTDPRARPVKLRAGVAHLAHRLPRGWIVPLAIEYPFWDERLPEALACFGKPIRIEASETVSPSAWLDRIEAGLQSTQDTLAAFALARDPAPFDILVRGNAAIGGVYDYWRRSLAWFRGETFHAEHSEEPSP
jgi:1-acyl-sn-glycerol-3-phosphate acyltransferase